MVERRSYGTGSLAERPKGSGKWVFRVRTGTDPLTGKPVRKNFAITAKGKIAAQKKANEIVANLEAQQPLGSSATVSQLLEEFLRHCRDRNLSPSTIDSYERIAENQFGPTIGHIPMQELNAHHLDTLYGELAKGPDGLKASSLRRYNAVLSSALAQAMKWGWLEKNVAKLVTLPEAPPGKVNSPDVKDVERFLDAAFDFSQMLGTFCYVAGVTAARRGEVAALRWSDIDDDIIHIRHSAYNVAGQQGIKSTKTGRERDIYVGQNMKDLLLQWRTHCDEIAHEHQVTLSENSFLFSRLPDFSKPLNVDTVTAQVRNVADSLDPPLPELHTHSFRHFAITELQGQGVGGTDVAARAGHSNPAFTLRRYSHPTPGRQRSAAKKAEKVIRVPKRAQSRTE